MWHGGICRHRQQLCCLCDLLNPFDLLAFNILDIYRESKFLQGQVALHFRSHGTFTVWTLCELLTSNSVILCHKTNPHYTLHIDKLYISYELFRVFKLKLNHPHKHTQPFNGPFTGTTWVSQYQKGKTNLDFTEARDSEWQWHQLGHMQVCTSLQTDNHSVFLQAGCPSCCPTNSIKSAEGKPCIHLT